MRDAPVWPVRVRLDAGQLELGGATTLGKLLGRGLGVGGILGPLGDYPMWVTVSGEVTVNGSRAEFVTRSAAIGRQRVPVSVLWRLVGGRPPALTWRMPKVVERVDVEAGRLVVHTRRVRPSGRVPGLGASAGVRAAPPALAQPDEPHPKGAQHLLEDRTLVRRPVPVGLLLQHG